MLSNNLYAAEGIQKIQAFQINPYFETYQFTKTKEFLDWFNKAKIGDQYVYKTPSTDGCNVCSGIVYKSSEKSIRDLGVFGCTLVMCPSELPEIRIY